MGDDYGGNGIDWRDANGNATTEAMSITKGQRIREARVVTDPTTPMLL